MKIKVKYFGMLTEITGLREEWIDSEGQSIGQLIDQLHTKYPSLKNKDFQVASGQKITDFNTRIDSDEIALLPPFSGG